MDDAAIYVGHTEHADNIECVGGLLEQKMLFACRVPFVINDAAKRGFHPDHLFFDLTGIAIKEICQ